VSTYSFYVALFFPLPYAVLKSLRVLRLLRVFRYMRSFKLLQEAILSKSKEMFISLQFLVVVTLMLSFVLYFYEHAAQPEVYDNGLKSVVWAFAQYIGDPGGFADTPPITGVGRIIACIIGVLGIALFAVPAGLIGAGFSEAMEAELHKEVVVKNIEKLKTAFERKLDRPTGFQIVPQHISICDMQARLGMKVDDIFDAVEGSKEFRLINLAVTQTIEEHPQDKLAIAHFPKNRSYGYCIDRGSKVTIVSPGSFIEPAIGNFSYYLALIGGFNYTSRECGDMLPYKSYYIFPDRSTHEENLDEYMSDLELLTSKEGSWSFTTLVASGANEPSYPTHFHFSAGGAKGVETFDEEGLVVKDIDAYREFYQEIRVKLLEEFGIDSDHQRYHASTSPNLFARKYKEGRGTQNNIICRIAWSACLWDMRRIAMAKTMADMLNKHFGVGEEVAYDSSLKEKKCGY
jgi:voltage-gated potassium channel